LPSGYSESFRNEFMGRDDRNRTGTALRRTPGRPRGLPLKAVICLRAYKKLEGLHDLAVLWPTWTPDRPGVRAGSTPSA
jgi:hypothetical protein